MIPSHLIQRAIITKLKADTALVALLNSSNDIKEEQYQDDTFQYPLIRVGVNVQTPLGNAVGRTKLSNILFTIMLASEKPSSFEINKIGNRVVVLLFDNQIKGTDENGNINYFILNRIDLVSEGSADRSFDRIWTKEVYFMSECYLL